MQRKLDARRQRSDDELIKDAGLVLDFDEMARKGSMTREETSIAKWYGVYHSRQSGDHMIRVVIPGGKLTSVQARALSRMSRRYSPGRISFTTRQSAQFHKVQLHDLPHLLRDLHAAGLTSFHGCGDVTRNVAACPWAENCPHRRFDVRPYAEKTARVLSDSRDLDNLPRKFKVTYSGCGGDCGQPHINCVGAVAVLRRGPDGGEQRGFRVVLGGGMGWKPFVAQPLYTFVPQDRMVAVTRAAGLLFRDHGDRHIRMYARLKWVVHRLGIDRCRELLEGYLRDEGVSLEGFETAPVQDVGPQVPDRPLAVELPVGTDGGAIQRVRVPKGEIASDALHRLAELSEMYADKHVYSTNRQNLELHGVAERHLPVLREEIRRTGLEAEGFFELRDVVTCVGTTYCPLAVSTTHRLFDSLQGLIADERYAPIRKKVLINITGCPNNCSPTYIADIGLRGLRMRNADTGSTEGYQIRVGGSQTSFGEVVGEFKEDDCIGVVQAVLDRFLQLHGNPGGSLAESVAEHGVAPYREAIDALGISYDMAPNTLEMSEFTGLVHQGRDFKAIARDIPCQEACPARTNVPGYIRHIAHDNPQAAFLINQEDNVFPGVLGRICTRPCEDACRYQWTSTRGAVRICHLKRSAADDKPAPASPLPAWFNEPTGKRVAIVGGGPAGLACARELKRYGHAVTLYERLPYLGGQMRFGIPVFRLPRNVLEEDIAAVVDSGIEIRLHTEVDFDALMRLADEYDAAIVACGANRPRALELPGLDEGLAIEGLHFMRRYNDEEPLSVSGDVVVIGGGFTSVDCARASRRLLGFDAEHRVGIYYRRGVAQMAASDDELAELSEERIHVETLVSPVAARCEGGRLVGVTFRRNILGDVPEDGGKPRFEPVPDSDFEVPCDTLIFAIGQEQEYEILPDGVSLSGGHRTTRSNLFVAGDFATENADVISAVADGKSCAHEVDAVLMGSPRRRDYVRLVSTAITGRTREDDLVYPPHMPMIPVLHRGDNHEVERGYDAQDTDTHAWRCYLCDHKFEIDQDKCIQCDWCIRVSPRNCILRLADLQRDRTGNPASWTEVPKSEPDRITYIWIDSDECIRCGNCINICPVDAISVRKCERLSACPGAGED